MALWEKTQHNSAAMLLAMFRCFAEVDSSELSNELIKKHLAGIICLLSSIGRLGILMIFWKH